MPRPTPPARRGPAGPTAAELMTAGPRSCAPGSTGAEVAAILRDEDCGVVPVVEGGKPVGIVAERDLARAQARYPDLADRPATDLMARGLATVARSATRDEVARAFTGARGERVLVVEPDGSLAGIIARADMAPHMDLKRLAQLDAAIARRTPPARPPETTPHAPAGRWAWAKPRAFWELLRDTARAWTEDKVPRLGAALAFYSILSIAPLLIIAIAVAAVAFGERAAKGELVGQIEKMVGAEGAKAIQDMLANAHKPGSGLIATILGVATLLAAASGVFGQLQDALNTIWEVRPKPGRGLLAGIKDRLLPFLMVLATGALLLVSLALSTAVSATLALATKLTPGLAPLLQLGDVLVSAVVVTLLFAMIFKLLPDAKVAWRDVWVGASLTTVLFLIGKAAIGIYLGRGSYGSAYGAAGSLVVLLVWTYYSSQILFFGAEFTKTYADRHGSRIEPSAGAEPVTADARAQQGIAKAGR